MTISGVSSTSTTNTTAATTQIDNPLSSLGKLDFLEMLITKLKYQDPTNPISDESFVADMAQFSSLEQMTNMNSGFTTTNEALQSLNENIIGLMLMQNTTQAASLIGKTVVVTADETSGATVSGQVSVVRFVDGLPRIVVDGIEYSLSAVKEIQA